MLDPPIAGAADPPIAGAADPPIADDTTLFPSSFTPVTTSDKLEPIYKLEPVSGELELPIAEAEGSLRRRPSGSGKEPEPAAFADSPSSQPLTR